MLSTSAPHKQEALQFLCIRLPTGIMALLPTQQLLEIANLNLNQIIPIPDTSPSLLGCCNWRGAVLWLVDLGHLLGFEPLYTQSLRKGQLHTVIVHKNGQQLGLGVDQVLQMVWCNPSQIQPAPSQHVTLELAQCLQGYWSDQSGTVWWVLDAESIMDSLG